MYLSKDANQILEKLNKDGFEAYYVGGCVRDMLMGRQPNDYDIATNAMPEQVMERFDTIPTGIAHGTVSIKLNYQTFEITTFRKDGEYKDHRRPETVEYSTQLEEDLKRRDFTMNAIAMDSHGNVFDPFSGREDIKKGIIRAVGNPHDRMEEDALRIMRALRFAATLGFSIDPHTEESLFDLKDTLSFISAERIQTEMKKLLLGDYAEEILLKYAQIISVIVPEISETIGFDQHNPWHCYTLYEHIVRSVASIEKDPILRYTMFLHDLGKIKCFFIGDDGKGHFIGHGKVGAQIASAVCRRLKLDRQSANRIELLVRIHDLSIPLTRKSLLFFLHNYGETVYLQYLSVRRADSLAQSERAEKSLTELEKSRRLYEQVISEKPCYSLSTLAINGNDVKVYETDGKVIGNVLNAILIRVMSGKLPNDREKLLAEIPKYFK